MTDPLKFLSIYRPHGAASVIDLPDVTTMTVDDRDDADTTGRIASISRWHRRFLRTARDVVLSGSDPRVDGVDWVKISKWPSADYKAEYSRWCQEELLRHFDTRFVLIWQYDGFAVNPALWRDDFLEYDYIGAPWVVGGVGVVGNGGFSMRSRKFCEAAGRIPRCGSRAEDIFFCYERKDDMVREGVRFAPSHVANAWSTDYENGDVSRHFGFHGHYLLKRVAAITNQWIDVSSERKVRR